MQKTTRQILIALVIVLLLIVFYLIYKDIMKQNGINVQSAMQIVYDSTAKTIKYVFLIPALDMKYAGATMLLTSFAPDNATTELYPADVLSLFIAALQTVPVKVAITPIDGVPPNNLLTNYVETNTVPRAYTGGSITASGTGIVRITPN